MDLLNLLLSRRSIRAVHRIPHSSKGSGDHFGRRAPLPLQPGRRPWEFVVVQNPKTLEALSHCRQGSAAMLSGAKAAILVFADPEKTDVWTEDCAIAMSNMHLMAHHLGLGSCWIQGRLRQAEDGTSTEAFCRALLSVPGPLHLGGHSLPGFPAIQPESHSLEDLPREKIHWDTF